MSRINDFDLSNSEGIKQLMSTILMEMYINDNPKLDMTLTLDGGTEVQYQIQLVSINGNPVKES